jgi:hypothetical protein
VTVIVERAVVAVIKLEAPSMEEADRAFADLRTRVDFTLPKLRFKPCSIIGRTITLRTVSIRGAIGKVPE